MVRDNRRDIKAALRNHIHCQREVVQCIRADGADESDIFAEEFGEMETVNLVIRHAEREERAASFQEL